VHASKNFPCLFKFVSCPTHPMAIAIAVWSVFHAFLYASYIDALHRSLELAPGQRETVVPVADIKITNVALGDRVVDSTGRSTVKLIYNPYIHDDDEDEESPDEQTTVLCSLTAGKVCSFVVGKMALLLSSASLSILPRTLFWRRRRHLLLQSGAKSLF
jgi:hypothetical protein